MGEGLFGSVMPSPHTQRLKEEIIAVIHVIFPQAIDGAIKASTWETAFHIKLRQALDACGASIECPNFKFADTPEGQFVEAVFPAQGQLEHEQNRRQIIQKMKARAQTGYDCRSKTISYRYERVNGHEKMLMPDEPNASRRTRATSKDIS